MCVHCISIHKWQCNIHVWTIWSTVRKLCIRGPSSKCLNRVECDLEVFSNRAIFNCLFLRSQQRRYTENWNFFKSNFWTKTNPIAELYHGVALFCSMTWQLLTNPLIMTDGVTYKRSCDLYCNYIWGNFERPSLFMRCGYYWHSSLVFIFLCFPKSESTLVPLYDLTTYASFWLRRWAVDVGSISKLTLHSSCLIGWMFKWLNLFE